MLNSAIMKTKSMNSCSECKYEFASMPQAEDSQNPANWTPSIIAS